MNTAGAPLVVSIGTTNPRNVAGLGRDVRTAADYGVAIEMAIAAVSAQDEGGVHAIFALPGAVVTGQLDAIRFSSARAIRVGALGNAQNAEAIARFLQRQSGVPVVFDPVMRASAGGSLYDGDALAAVRAFMQHAAAFLTPNIEEAAQLTGMTIVTHADMADAGRRLIDCGANAALVKGGHLPGDPVDVFVTHESVERFADSRLAQRMRGTGCALAMALACELALGREPRDAVKGARAYVRANIARS